jgi:integrase
MTDFCTSSDRPTTPRRVWLLAFGLTPGEILRLTPSDVDVEAREVRLPARTMPLTAAAVAALRPWVERQHFHGAEWLFVGRHGRRASRFVLQHAVNRLAVRGEVCGRVSMTGFRALFLARCLRRGIAIDCVLDLLGIQVPATLRPYAPHRGASARRALQAHQTVDMLDRLTLFE